MVFTEGQAVAVGRERVDEMAAISMDFPLAGTGRQNAKIPRQNCTLGPGAPAHFDPKS